MKTTTNTLVLFFAFFISVSSQTTSNYGLLPLKKVVGAKQSIDGRWIKYDGSLYYDMESLRKDLISPILFENNSDIVEVKATLDNEFVYYGRSNFQKFRTDWVPTVKAQVQKDPSPAVLISFTVFALLCINWFRISTQRKFYE